MKTTRATHLLMKKGISHRVVPYEYDPNATRIGEHAAQSIGVAPGKLLKCLMVDVTGKPCCALIPSDRELSMKAVARVMDGKKAEMLSVEDAERITGYKVGGISPFAQRKRVPVFIEDSAMAHETVFINAGQRGFQIEISPQAAVKVLDARNLAMLK